MSAKHSPFTINSLFAHKSLSLPTVTPDGKLACFVASQPDKKTNKTISELWCKAQDGKTWQVTYGGQANKPQFSPDGKKLGFLSNRSHDKQQVFVMGDTFCEGQQVTSFEQGVFDFRFSPDGRWLAVIAAADRNEKEKKRDTEKLDWWTVDRDERRRQLWLIKTNGLGKPRQLSVDSEHVNTVTFTPDGKRAVYCSCPNATIDSQWTASQIKAVSVTGRGRKTICTLPGRQVESRMSVSPDGTQLVFCEPKSKRHNFHNMVKIVDLKSGKKKTVTRDFDRQSMNPLWLSNDEIFFESDNETNFCLYTCKPGSSPSKIDTPNGLAGQAVYAPKANQLFYIYSHATQPDELCSRSLDDAVRHTVLTNVNRSIARLKLAEVDVIKWKSKDGLAVEGLLYLPTKARTRKPYPLIVMPHGGPYASSINSYQTAAMPNIYTAAGYACLLPNFRGSTSYGCEFTHKNINNWGPGPWDDISSGIDALIRRGIVDGKRLSIFGGSYGGYMTAWAIGQTNRFKSAVAVAAVINNLSMVGTTDIPHYQMQASNYTKPDFTANYWREQSPLHHVDKARTPTLIITGDSDKRVPPGQSYELYRALKLRGVETELVLYPREPHGVSEPRHRLHYFKQILDWINQYTM